MFLQMIHKALGILLITSGILSAGINLQELTTKYYSKLATPAQVAKAIKAYGSYIGNKGMTLDDYKATISAEWEDVSVLGKATKVTVDITKQYEYKDCKKVMQNLSKYDGVSLLKLGESTEGRDMLALEIDRTETPKEVIILTGSIHAREGAGTVFILKELAELLAGAESNSMLQEYLSRYKIVALPMCNPDCREGLITNEKKYSTSSGELWKSYTNGTDGNRNFPGVSWGQIAKGNKKMSLIASKANGLYYPGDSAGSCAETRVIMKFLHHYVVEEQAMILIDYHQMGRISYAGKPWQTKEQENRCIDLAKWMLSGLNSGNSSKYSYVAEGSDYGLRGEGSTLTDFAVTLATGAKFSSYYGFYTYENEKGVATPLIAIGDLDDATFSIEEANSKFRTMTFEIGSNGSFRGFSTTARKLLAKEYKQYHFDEVIENVFKYCDERGKD